MREEKAESRQYINSDALRAVEVLNKGYEEYLESNAERMAAPWTVFPCIKRCFVEDRSSLLDCLGQPSCSSCPLFPTVTVCRFSVKSEAGMAKGGAHGDGIICFY